VHLNYHHLLYFWVVVQEGSIAGAARRLRLAPSTITGQVRRLEEALGDKLFERVGRGLALTPCGRLVYDCAERIFPLGEELLEVLSGRDGTRAVPLRVGVADVLPKLVVCALLRPALEGAKPARLVLREDRSVAEFLDDLAAHTLDLVLADAPAPPGRPELFNHRLGECGTTVFGVQAHVRGRRKSFPRSLDRSPFLVAGINSARRRGLEQWCKEHGIAPVIVAEIDDAALIMELGREGRGLFSGPTLFEREIRDRYAVEIVGRLPELRQQFYAIRAERGVRHPVVQAACAAICHQTALGV
jgi:LysR family transcriptional activator of nhaA